MVPKGIVAVEVARRRGRVARRAAIVYAITTVLYNLYWYLMLFMIGEAEVQSRDLDQRGLPAPTAAQSDPPV